MNRYDLRTMARIRLKEARVLFKNKCYDGAYYLAGYAVECGLKACIAKKTKKYDFPDKKTVQGSYTHDFLTLVQMADLEDKLNSVLAADAQFRQNWMIVKGWKEVSRYQCCPEAEARALLRAIGQPRHGVMQWLRFFW